MKLHQEILLSDLENKKDDYYKTIDKVRGMASDVGIPAPSNLITDGLIHRFPTNGKKNDDAGWYQLNESEYGITGAIGDHRRTFGFGKNYIPIKAYSRPLSPIEHAKMSAIIKDQAEKAQIEMEKKHNQASNESIFIWDNAQYSSIDHPYLQKKGLNSTHGAKISGDGRLILPAYDKDNNLKCIQYISHDSKKRPQPGGTLKNHFWIIGDIKEKVFITEGFATGATVKEETGFPVVIAYTADNLTSTAKQIKELYPNTEIIIAADNDSDKEENRGKDKGEIQANRASKETGCSVILPPAPGDFNDMKSRGEDVKSILLQEDEEDWLISIDDLIKEPTPVRWLIKGWLQRDSLVMMHGPSGCGKTFVILDMALKISLGFDSWIGEKVRNSPVVYLAGEGHRGLAVRVKGWLQHNNVTDMNKYDFVLSRTGTDLNKSHGLNKVISSIDKLPKPPHLIIVDTLHRFFDGNEDKSESAREMIVSCDTLKHRYGCSVVLIHHTGLSENAQERGRGSGAWKAALENEISVQPESETTIKIKAVKMKDSEYPEDIYVNKRQIHVNGWLDEDKEQVTTVVLEQTGAPEKREDSALKKAKANIKIAWEKHSGELSPSGIPYISTKSWKKYFMEDLGKDDKAASQAVKKSASGVASKLFKNGVIEAFNGGYVVKDEGLIAQIMVGTKGTL